MSDSYRQHQIDSLGYPLIAMASQGGPYPDEAFIAGFYLASINLLLGKGSGVIEMGVLPTAALPQLDLIAMYWGYRLVAGEQADEHGGGWSHFMLIPISKDVAP